MKKLMMIACMMLFSTAMFADKGDIMIGGGISYGFHSSIPTTRTSVLVSRVPTNSWRISVLPLR